MGTAARRDERESGARGEAGDKRESSAVEKSVNGGGISAYGG